MPYLTLFYVRHILTISYITWSYLRIDFIGTLMRKSIYKYYLICSVIRIKIVLFENHRRIEMCIANKT